MTELTEDKRPESPLDQVNRQASKDAAGGEEPAEGEPFYYSPPATPNAGVTKSPSNEVVPGEFDDDGNPIPKGEDAQPRGEAGTQIDYEAHTVPELREMAEERDIQIRSDANKAEIIRALKKGS